MYFIIILHQLIASFSHIVAKDITSKIEPSSILFYRSLVAALFFFLLVYFKNSRKKIDKFDYKYLIILAFLNIPLNQFLFLVSIKMTTAPNVALAYSLSPIFVFIVAHYFLKEKSTYIKAIGILIAISGTIFLLYEKGFNFHSEAFWGDILAIFASISWALYTVIGKNMSQKYGSIFSTSITMILGFFLYSIIYMFIPSKANPLDFSFSNWLEILYLGTFTSGVGYILWYYALKKIQASKISVFNNLQPVFTTILAIIFFHQTLTIYFLAGGALVLIGVIITQKG
jgi:drug/metabolite transporter (DMT)-like permease